MDSIAPQIIACRGGARRAGAAFHPSLLCVSCRRQWNAELFMRGEWLDNGKAAIAGRVCCRAAARTHAASWSSFFLFSSDTTRSGVICYLLPVFRTVFFCRCPPHGRKDVMAMARNQGSAQGCAIAVQYSKKMPGRGGEELKERRLKIEMTIRSIIFSDLFNPQRMQMSQKLGEWGKQATDVECKSIVTLRQVVEGKFPSPHFVA